MSASAPEEPLRPDRGRIGALLRDSAAYGIGTVAVRAAPIVLVPLLTRVLTREDYGSVDLLTAAMYLAAMLLTLGLDTAAWRFFFDTNDERERARVLTTALTLQLAVSSAVVVPLAMLGAPLGRIIVGGTGPHGWDVAWALVGVPFFVGTSTVTTMLRARFLIARCNILACTQLAAVLLLVVGAVASGHRTVTAVIAATSLAYAAVFMVGVAMVHDGLAAGWSWTCARGMLRFGLPLVPANLALWSLPYAGRFVVAHVSGTADVALLAVATKPVVVVTLMVTAFQAAWQPFSLSIHARADAPRVYDRVLLYFTVAGGTVAILLGIMARPVLLIAAPHVYAGAAPAVTWLAFGALAGGVYLITGIGAAVVKRPELVTAALLAGAVANVALAIVLCPRLGVEGAGLANLGGAALSAYLAYVLVRRRYPVRYSLRPARELFGVFLAVALVETRLVLSDVWADTVMRGMLAAICVLATATWAWRRGLIRRHTPIFGVAAVATATPS